MPLPVPPATPTVAAMEPEEQTASEEAAAQERKPAPSVTAQPVTSSVIPVPRVETPVDGHANGNDPGNSRPDVATAPTANVVNVDPTTEVGDEPPTFWDRMGSYRPSLPLLLGLVLVTICVAYIYRPQETPPKRRGSQESTESKRRFDKEFDEQKPKSMSARNDRPASDLDAPLTESNDGSQMPTLDMPTNAPGHTKAMDASRDPSSSESVAGFRPRTDDGSESASTSEDPTGSSGLAGSRAKLAARPSPTEHFESTPPPTMPEAPQVQPEGGNGEELDEDGPPPDISGRSYPQTNPMNFFYRPVTPETREASRPTSSQGETR